MLRPLPRPLVRVILCLHIGFSTSRDQDSVHVRAWRYSYEGRRGAAQSMFWFNFLQEAVANLIRFVLRNSILPSHTTMWIKMRTVDHDFKVCYNLKQEILVALNIRLYEPPSHQTCIGR